MSRIVVENAGNVEQQIRANTLPGERCVWHGVSLDRQVAMVFALVDEPCPMCSCAPQAPKPEPVPVPAEPQPQRHKPGPKPRVRR